MNEHESWMRLALEEAARALALGEPPFGALVVDAAGEVVARGHDTVRARRDWTRHGEIETVRAAIKVRGSILADCTLVTTVEPCPMCFTAAWLAEMPRIIYGATMQEIAAIVPEAHRELRVPCEQMNAMSGLPLTIFSGVLREECARLFQTEPNRTTSTS